MKRLPGFAVTLSRSCRLNDIVELPELSLVFEYVNKDLANYINNYGALISMPRTVKVRLFELPFSRAKSGLPV